jgi:hypothetical protein
MICIVIRKVASKHSMYGTLAGILTDLGGNVPGSTTITWLREQDNLNQTQLAARAGMNASKILPIETSARNVTLSTLARVAYALNTRIKIQFVPAKAKKR